MNNGRYVLCLDYGRAPLLVVEIRVYASIAEGEECRGFIQYLLCT